MKRFLSYIIVIMLIVLMVVFPRETVESAKKAVNLCAEIIIPSLFPFFVCSGLVVRSGLAERIAVFAKPVMQPVFNVNENGAAAFVLGILSGYPLGAATACELYDKGCLSRTETERLLGFCNNSGPLFILGAVGSAMYASVGTGLVLYAAHLAAAVSVGVIFGLFDKKTEGKNVVKQAELKSIADIFPGVLSAAADNMITVCCAVIFFSTMSGLVTSLLPSDGLVKALVCAAAELTSGTKIISELSVPLCCRLIMSAFTVGFAGLCVHLQVISICAGRGLSLKPYIIGKFLHGALSALYVLLILQFVPVTETVFREIPQKSAAIMAGSLYQAVTVIFAVLLSCMVMVLTACTNKKLKKFQKNY